jgi:hypothetical protein
LAIFNRVPKLKEILPVYAIIVLMIYGWTIFNFNYNLPSWLHYLNMGEIMTIVAYSMAINLLESIFVLLGVIAVGLVFPKKWFAEAFIARGASLSILVLGLMMYVANQFTYKEYYPTEMIHWSPVLLLLMGLFVYFLGRMEFLRTGIEFFADRAIIFLYISIPVSILSLIVVIIQNIV